MFGIGFGEMLLIGVVILIAVGPKRLPQLMKTVGQGVREIRRASNDLRRSVGIDEMMREADVREAFREPLREIQKPAARPTRRALSPAELDAELPLHGVDVAEAEYRARVGEPVSRAQPVPEAAAGTVEES